MAQTDTTQKKSNTGLTSAKRSKNDEFYTQYADIESEVSAYLEYNPDVFADKTILLPCDDPEWSNFTKYFAQNFDRFRLRKLISTSYSPASRTVKKQPTLFETESPQYDEEKSNTRGKVCTLTRNITGDNRVGLDDFEWRYLEGDGDFRSDEVRALRDEADIVATNPPFSLFREFLEWIRDADKSFLILGNKNAITYKEVFPHIRANQIWTGVTGFNQDMLFTTPEPVDTASLPATAYRTVDGVAYRRAAAIWFTNLEHGRRHEELALMTEADNIKFGHKSIKGKGYKKYDNYDAIEVPYTKSIPSDYEGVMGVPISFLDKYCPEQFEIVGCSYSYGVPASWPKSTNMAPTVGGENIYKRLLIKHRKPAN